MASARVRVEFRGQKVKVFEAKPGERVSVKVNEQCMFVSAFKGQVARQIGVVPLEVMAAAEILDADDS